MVLSTAIREQPLGIVLIDFAFQKSVRREHRLEAGVHLGLMIERGGLQHPLELGDHLCLLINGVGRGKALFFYIAGADGVELRIAGKGDRWQEVPERKHQKET